MNTKLLRISYITCALLANMASVTHVYAENYFADSAISIKRLDFKAQSTDGSTNYRLSPVFTMLSVTGGVIFGKLYVTANIENSVTDAKIDDVILNGDSDRLSRNDRSVTIGYYTKNNVSIFLGYLTGETEDRYRSPNKFNESGTIIFSESGLYVGANYIYLLSPGALSLNLAYAFLSGTYDLKYQNDNDFGALNHSGDTTGVSIGAKYVSPFNKQINIFVGAKINLFKFDSNSFDSEEKFYIAQAGASYKF